VECDASIMEGGGGFGAVGAVQGQHWVGEGSGIGMKLEIMKGEDDSEEMRGDGGTCH